MFGPKVLLIAASLLAQAPQQVVIVPRGVPDDVRLCVEPPEDTFDIKCVTIGQLRVFLYAPETDRVEATSAK